MKLSTFRLIIIMILSSALSLGVYHYFFSNKSAVQIMYQPTPSLVNLSNKLDNPAHRRGWSSTAPLNFTSAATVATAAVVSVTANDGNDYTFFGNDQFETSMGSGVIINKEGFLVTNRHVIENMNNIQVTLLNNSVYPASLVGIDASTDLAIIKIDGHDFSFLEFDDSDKTAIGEWVLAVGNPFSLNSTVTAGIVSAKGRNINILEDPYAIESFIQTDAAINAGNSGGALVNTNGKLVGINTAILTKSGRYEGYSFAVPSNLVKKVSEDIITYGVVQRAYIGVGIEKLNLRTAAKMGMDHAYGILINRIERNSAADFAKLKVGDVILQIDNVITNELSILQERIAMRRPGDEIIVKLRRGDSIFLVPLVLKNVNNETELIRAPRNKLMMEIGFKIRDLNNFERELHELEGVKVTGVDSKGIASELKLSKGFVLEFCNDVKITNVNQFMLIMESVKGDIYLEGRYTEGDGSNHTYIIRR